MNKNNENRGCGINARFSCVFLTKPLTNISPTVLFFVGKVFWSKPCRAFLPQCLLRRRDGGMTEIPGTEAMRQRLGDAAIAVVPIRLPAGVWSGQRGLGSNASHLLRRSRHDRGAPGAPCGHGRGRGLPAAAAAARLRNRKASAYEPGCGVLEGVAFLDGMIFSIFTEGVAFFDGMILSFFTEELFSFLCFLIVDGAVLARTRPSTLFVFM